MESEKKYWLDDSANVRKLYYGLWIICVLLVVLDFFYIKHGHYSWEEIVGFSAIFGFLGCVGLIFASKGLRRIVMRDEEFYDR